MANWPELERISVSTAIQTEDVNLPLKEFRDRPSHTSPNTNCQRWGEIDEEVLTQLRCVTWPTGESQVNGKRVQKNLSSVRVYDLYGATGGHIRW